MPTNIIVHSKYITGNGIPSGTNSFRTSIGTGQHYFDRDGRTWYIYKGSVVKWVVDPEMTEAWRNGTGGTAPTVKVGTTQTGAPGTPAQVTDSDPSENLILDFIIPQGIKGDKGDPGTGGGTTVNSASIVVVPNGTDDTNNLKAAFKASKDYGKSIELYGRYKTFQDIMIDKDHMNIVVDSKRAVIEGFGIKRVKPLNNDEALNTMVAAQYHFDGLTLKGGVFEPGPSYGSTFTNLRFEGANSLFKLQFSLGAKVNNPHFINCTKGLLIDFGDWTGANNFNSQSNHTQVNGGRFYGHSTSEIGIGVYAASGCSVKDFIIEGHSVKTGIDWDAKGSSVVKDFSIENVHYECPNGGDQFIKLRMTGNDIITIKKCFGQYPVKFLDASSSSGLSYIEIGGVTWWRGKGDTSGSNGQGKMFTTNNVTLHFEKNHAFNNVNANMWEGTAPKFAGSEGATIQEYHTYTVNYINPK